MTLNDIHKRLLEYNTPDRLQLIRAEYNGTDEGFIQLVTEILKEVERDHLSKVYERVNFLYMNDKDQQAQEYERLNIPNRFVDTLRIELENYIPGIKAEIPVVIEKEYNIEHLHIFKPKGFELWDALYKRFRIKTHNSRSLNFMYSQMVYDGFINEIPLVMLQDWLNKNYPLKDPYHIRQFLLRGELFQNKFDIYEPIRNCM